jgi:hypothetical protein
MIESLVSEIPDDNDNLYIDPRLAGARMVGLDDTNIQGAWVLPLLLGKDVNGNDQRWQIGFDGTQLITQYGRVNGVLQTVCRNVSTNTSGRNLIEQSFLEGKRRFLDKCYEGYHTEGTNSNISFEPMLADKYKFTQFETLTPNKWGKQLSKWPAVYFQPKIDGVRCLMTHQASGVIKTSRKNRVYPHLKHLDKDVELLLSVLPPGTLLDGELYNHELPFEEITSIVRRTVNVRPDEYKIQYWVFDILSDGQFEERYLRLFNAYEQVKDKLKYIILVPIYQLPSEDKILEYLDMFEQAGYEGLVLRKTGPKTNYIQGRTANLLKVKKFISSEGQVIEVKESSATEAGCAQFVLYDPTINSRFDVRPSGSFEQRREWLKHPELVLGKTYTYKYFEIAGDGNPRFPVGIGFRDYE